VRTKLLEGAAGEYSGGGFPASYLLSGANETSTGALSLKMAGSKFVWTDEMPSGGKSFDWGGMKARFTSGAKIPVRRANTQV
jgi:hypothetical protein